MEENNTSYVKGFNHGYILEQYEPEIAEMLVNSIQSDGDYENGLIDGQKEYAQEKQIKDLERLRVSRERGQKRER